MELNCIQGQRGTLQALLGHAIDMSAIYVHSVSADSRQAVQKVEEAIGPKWTQVPVWPEPVTNVTR